MGILRTDKLSGLETPTPVTGSVSFDGDGDYLIVNSQTLNANQFTLECWIYPTNLTGNKWLFSQYTVGNANRTSLYIDDGVLLVFNGNQGSTIGSTTLQTNKWYHLAFVRNASTLTAYLNGIEEFEKTNFAGPHQANTYIGSYDGAGATDSFEGYISNVRVVNSLLYTENFTPPTRELQPIGDTVLLCCNNPDSAGAEATGKTITVNGNAVASTFSPGLTRDFTYGTQFDGVSRFDTQGYFVPPSGNTQNRYTLGLDEIVTDGLVLHLDAGNPFSYPATGVGTKWTDLSGNNNHGTLVNGVSYTENNRGSLVFDGVDDYVNCTSGVIANNSSFSVDIWFKRGAQADKYLYSEGSTISSSPFWGITSHSVGGTLTNLRIYARNNSGTEELDFQPTGTGYLIYNDTNRNLVVSYSSNTIYFYIDGVYIGSNSWTKGSYSNLNQINIGRFAALASVGGYMNGNIYAIKTYNKALTAQEVLQNYEALKGRYGHS